MDSRSPSSFREQPYQYRPKNSTLSRWESPRTKLFRAAFSSPSSKLASGPAVSPRQSSSSSKAASKGEERFPAVFHRLRFSHKFRVTRRA